MSNGAKATSTRRPGRPEAGSEDKEARILSEALTLFSTQGYVATSLADIARTSDISKAGLLYHYSPKDQLPTAVLDERDRRIVSRLPRPEEGTEAVLDVWADMVTHNQHHPDDVALYTVMSATVVNSKHQAHPWFREHLIGTISYLVDAFGYGKTTGEIRENAPNEQIARRLVVISNGLQVQWLCACADGGRTLNMHEVMAGVAVDMKEWWLAHPE